MRSGMSKTLTGDKELDRKLKALSTKISQKAMASGVRAGLSELRKHMRRATANPRVRKTIAARFKRKKKFGITEAKVGAGVGKHKTAEAGPRSRPGVGISKQNAHWYFMGTKARSTSNGASRGVMPASTAISRGASSGMGSAMVKMRAKIRKVIETEVNKLK
jgi:hypothetical protein